MEKWRDIQGYEGLYQVSESGGVKRLSHIAEYKDGAKHHYEERTLSPVLQATGYLTVTLCRGGEQRPVGVHRLVAETFIPNPDNKPQVNHIDGCKTNNKASNLEWCTAKENSDHAWRLGLSKITDKHKTPAGKNAKPIECLETGEIFKSAREAERRLGISNQNISKVLKGKRSKAGGYSFRYAALTKERYT